MLLTPITTAGTKSSRSHDKSCATSVQKCAHVRTAVLHLSRLASFCSETQNFRSLKNWQSTNFGQRRLWLLFWFPFLAAAVIELKPEEENELTGESNGKKTLRASLDVRSGPVRFGSVCPGRQTHKNRPKNFVFHFFLSCFRQRLFKVSING